MVVRMSQLQVRRPSPVWLKHEKRLSLCRQQRKGYQQPPLLKPTPKYRKKTDARLHRLPEQVVLPMRAPNKKYPNKQLQLRQREPLKNWLMPPNRQLKLGRNELHRQTERRARIRINAVRKPLRVPKP